MENQGKHPQEQVCPTCNEAESFGTIQFPYNEELERCVLGALITDSHFPYREIDNLHKELFYKLAHQVIFEAIQNLYYNTSVAVDLLTVVNELHREGKLEQAGGAEYVSRLSDNIASSAHLQTHIALLVEKYVHREVLRTAAELLKEANDATCDPLMLLEKGIWSLERIFENIPHTDPAPLGNILDSVANNNQSFWEQAVLGIPSGFASFDTITRGFQPGTLTVLASLPSMGKTSCALSMARNMASVYRIPVAFFSLQKSCTGLASWLIFQETGMPPSQLIDDEKNNHEKRRMIYERMDALTEAPLYIDDTDRISFIQLRSTCRRMMIEHYIRMIFIDGLPQVYVSTESNPNHDRANELCLVSHKIKSLAQELNIPILITTSFDHKTDNYQGNRPTLSDLQESGCIDEVADIVIGLYRTEQDECSNNKEGKASLQILKNRDGELGLVDVRFDKKSMMFFDPSAPRPKYKPQKKKKASVTSVKKRQEDEIDTSDLPF